MAQCTGCLWPVRPTQLRACPECLQGDNKGFLVARQKVYTTVEHLCRFHSAPFQQFLEYVLALPFLEAPQYQLCQQLFEPLLEEPSQRPLARTYVSAAQAKVRRSAPDLKLQRFPRFSSSLPWSAL